jgi:hypothetical protein
VRSSAYEDEGFATLELAHHFDKSLYTPAPGENFFRHLGDISIEFADHSPAHPPHAACAARHGALPRDDRTNDGGYSCCWLPSDAVSPGW